MAMCTSSVHMSRSSVPIAPSWARPIAPLPPSTSLTNPLSHCLGPMDSSNVGGTHAQEKGEKFSMTCLVQELSMLEERSNRMVGKQMSFFMSNNPNKIGSRVRMRRTFKELTRDFTCKHTSCKKRYATRSSLATHLRLKHLHEELPDTEKKPVVNNTKSLIKKQKVKVKRSMSESSINMATTQITPQKFQTLEPLSFDLPQIDAKKIKPKLDMEIFPDSLHYAWTQCSKIMDSTNSPYSFTENPLLSMSNLESFSETTTTSNTPFTPITELIPSTFNSPFATLGDILLNDSMELGYPPIQPFEATWIGDSENHINYDRMGVENILDELKALVEGPMTEQTNGSAYVGRSVEMMVAPFN